MHTRPRGPSLDGSLFRVLIPALQEWTYHPEGSSELVKALRRWEGCRYRTSTPRTIWISFGPVACQTAATLAQQSFRHWGATEPREIDRIANRLLCDLNHPLQEGMEITAWKLQTHVRTGSLVSPLSDVLSVVITVIGAMGGHFLRERSLMVMTHYSLLQLSSEEDQIACTPFPQPPHPRELFLWTRSSAHPSFWSHASASKEHRSS